MTPAINLLKKNKIDFKLHRYVHDTKNTNFGSEAADKLGFPATQIFKTLLVTMNENNRDLAVVLIPVASMLNLKELSALLKVKKVELADKEIAEKTSGYLVGGISPLGQKRLLPTYIDNSALQFASIFISGGKRGLDIEIAPKDLAKLVRAKFIEIIIST